MENLVTKEYGENVIIEFSNNNKYCFCEFYDDLNATKTLVLYFNYKQVKNIGNIKFNNTFIPAFQIWKI